MTTTIGGLRDIITIQQSSVATSASGAQKATWTTYKSGVHAEVVQRSSREYWRGMKLDGEATHIVVIRYDSGVTRQLRVLWRSRVLTIIGVDVDAMNRFMVLQTKEDV
jgi:SPP1 family predicted phage head-tail adaptor